METLVELPARIARFDKPIAVRRAGAAGFRDWSGRGYVEDVHAAALGLRALGLAPGDRVAIIAESRPEWGIADLAIMSAGAITVPIYPTLSAPQAKYILADAGATVAIVSDRAQAVKLDGMRGELPDLRALVMMDADRGVEAAVTLFDDLLARGRSAAQGAVAEYERIARSVAAADLATIIYTSGTTGDPKGVMLTHRNLVTNLEASLAVLPVRTDDVALTFLPLSHTFERLVFHLYLYAGATVAFAEAIETIARDIAAVRPTLMTGVPRVYEKLHGRVLDAVREGSALRQRLFGWALGVGLARSRAILGRRPVPLGLALRHAVADRLVFAKIRGRVGGRVRMLISGSAPLPRPIAEFFHAVGLPIIEGYGLTETSPVLTVNPADAIRLGTVGRPIPGVEISIADDGEILARGLNVMQGYYRQPEASAAALDGGWFHTGDVGTIDGDGYLTITDRKKDLLVTSGGKKIAPQPIEHLIKAHPLVSEAIVIGDRRKFAAAIIVPDFAALETTLAALGKPPAPREELVTRPDVLALYEEPINAINRNLAQFERIKQIALVPGELSIDGGELTPTLKVKRRVLEEKYRDLIERIYGAE
jgi:long-chain acyl-CoA synthetase